MWSELQPCFFLQLLDESARPPPRLQRAPDVQGALGLWQASSGLMTPGNKGFSVCRGLILMLVGLLQCCLPLTGQHSLCHFYKLTLEGTLKAGVTMFQRICRHTLNYVLGQCLLCCHLLSSPTLVGPQASTANWSRRGT